MSQRTKRSKARLRAAQRAAWLDAPRRMSRYEGLLALAGGIAFTARAVHQVTTAQGEVHPVGTVGEGRYAPGGHGGLTGTSAQVGGAVFGLIGLVLIVAGLVGLFAKRR